MTLKDVKRITIGCWVKTAKTKEAVKIISMRHYNLEADKPFVEFDLLGFYSGPMTKRHEDLEFY